MGIPWVGGETFKNTTVDSPFQPIEIDENIGAVIVGFDRNFNYYKIQYAQLCLQKTECLFIATNKDRVTPLTPHQLWAGNAAMVSAIEGCSGRNAVVVGKPSGLFIELLCKSHNIDLKRACMIGDRLDTDILMGNDCGIKTCLVLSGVTSLEDVESESNSIQPTIILDDVTGLIECGRDAPDR
eukprot:CAMPEP_0114328112 /NCGR_PEP_ID=MMETSP0101-20121206/192_1 /TAXON_ID=38822 ORGANISM="Pteridomonas danica, Strain PT" /NCGR_SAMPLE_ID=MMETSP0101 /ASSEMBLY_ACC=CAM_ASM_000211 /LENGTH=182 /DNA_ID=CAMNT_0001457331 /DNA_START=359 /DNA_END=907 /DNA_ORIENTATION=+